MTSDIESRETGQSESLLVRLQQQLAELRGTIYESQDVKKAFQRLLDAGVDALPIPGEGNTWLRWQALSHIADADLSLCKLFEGHTDALAILHELKADVPKQAHSIWATWAAEAPQARVQLTGAYHDGQVRLNGTKAWCSGAAIVSHALVTAWNADGQQQLTAVKLEQPGVRITERGWNAIGMQDTGSVEVEFHEASAVPVGKPGEYLSRPGFWHGGAGVAACWYGGAQKLAEALRSACQRREEPHALAHLGAVDSFLWAARAALRDGAQWIDDYPQQDAELLTRRLRSICEQTGSEVMDHVGRALGARPYCQDAELARLLSDLPVFLRQSHAERDLATAGKKVASLPQGDWKL